MAAEFAATAKRMGELRACRPTCWSCMQKMEADGLGEVKAN